ncbi:MAG: LysR substrate-binding domain-containing protein [Rhodospirillales bacterium]
MDLQSLDDLIAVAESKSLSEAAIRRHVTQPAFTRRLQSIEKNLGIQVIRRGSKPARPSEALLRNIDDIRSLAYSLRRLRHDLLDTASPDRVLTIAALHAIALVHLPEALARLNRILPLSRIRLHAANRDECFTGLMTGQVRIMMVYETDLVRQPFNTELVERAALCTERFIPVCAPDDELTLSWLDPGAASRTPLVGYPEGGVLGGILRSDIFPRSSASFSIVASTEFSSAVLELCERRLGVGWVPELLAAEKIASGRLRVVDDPANFPIVEMTVSMLRIHAGEQGYTDSAWTELQGIFSKQT